MALASHGTQVFFDGDAIPGLSDISPPPLSRPTSERTCTSEADDAHQAGRRASTVCSFVMQIYPGDATQLALVDAFLNNGTNTYEVRYPDGTPWYFEGGVLSMHPAAPVEGVYRYNVQIQVISGISFSPLADSLKLEDGGFLLLESGDSILLE